MAVVYKIRRRSDGLFSTGGGSPSFNKNGKTWNTRGALSNHFAVIKEYGRYRDGKWQYRNPYEDCEVVVIEVVPSEMNTIPVEEWTVTAKTAAAKAAFAKRQLEWEIQRKEAEKARLLARLAELDK
jgi:hypothetical protein